MAGCGGLEHQAATPASQETRLRAGAASVVNNVTVDLQPGWNGVGLQSQRVNALSTNPAISGFAFYENGSYQTRPFTAEALNAGAGGRRGLFVRTETPTSFTYSGTDEAQGNFVDLVSGWNLVSFTTSTDLPGSSLSGPLGTLVLPTFYQINADNSLAEVNAQTGGLLRAGRAYWVFANGAARLTLPAPPAASPSPSPPGLGPAVSQLSPNSGWIGGTSGVLITGTGFQRVIDVRFGGTSVFFTHVSPTQLLCEAPPQAQLNPPSPSVHVRVITADGTSAAGDGALWTYNTAARPPGNPPAAGGGLAPVVVAAGAHTFNTDNGFFDGVLATGWDGVNGRWNATSFQLAAGGTLTVSGARAFQVNATSAVQIDGTIAAPGGPGGSGASGVGGAGGARGPGGAAGGAGASNGPGGNGSEVGAPAGGRGLGSFAGLGGGSGAGHLNAGAAANRAGGTAYTSIPTALVGGSGGGGGGGSGAQTGGGGGGGGGGAVRLESTAAVTISATGVINCSGGNGGDAFAAAPSTGSGGGGGGSGGSIHLIGTPVTQNGTLNVTGGSPGAGALAGLVGGGGSVGRTVP